MTRKLRLAPLAVACFTLLAITLALPVGAARAQGSADVNLVRQVQAALANAGFNPGPADGKAGPRTRRAIQAWQRAHGHPATGKLTRNQLRSLLAVTTPTRALQPKCAELPGRYLGDNDAECWEEAANRPGCFLWNPHYHSDRTTRWTGRCRRGVAEGHGTYSASVGSEHSAVRGTGTLVGGKASGHWIFELDDGHRHEGQYRNAKRHGRGTYTWPNGNRYEGEFRRNGDFHGYGIYTWANGERYEGQWHNDERTGYGTYTWPSGSRYEGEYRDGKPHGYGTYTRPDGQRFRGQWRHGCFGERNGTWAVVQTTKAACGY